MTSNAALRSPLCSVRREALWNGAPAAVVVSRDAVCMQVSQAVTVALFEECHYLPCRAT